VKSHGKQPASPRLRLLDVARQDVAYAIRGLRRRPGFTAVIVLTLSLGLGVNAAVFSLVSRLFADAPDAVREPAQVRRLYLAEPQPGGPADVGDRFNYPQITDLRSALGGVVPFTTYLADSVRLGDGDRARFATVHYTDANYWSLLGVTPAIGRPYDDAEARIDVPTPVAVVSDAFWKRELGARRDVVGHSIQLAGRATTIVGVAPPGFAGPDLGAADLWLPLGAMPMPAYGAEREWYQIRGVYRLRALVRIPSADRTRATEERLTSAFRAGSVAAGYRGDTAAAIITGPLAAALGPMTPPQETVISTRLAWLSLVVLLIACANVANLSLARLIDRRREIAVRLALGISRRRLAAQLLTETLLAAALSCVGAVVLGVFGARALRVLLMPQVHRQTTAIQWTVVVAIVIAAILAGIGITLVPASFVSRFAGLDALKAGHRATPGAGRRARGALVMCQTALAAALLVGAGLFLRSLNRVLAVDVGYDVARIIYATPSMLGDRGGEDDSRRGELDNGLREAARRLATTPGVERVALASSGPMAGYYSTVLSVPGLDSMPTLAGDEPAGRDVSPEFWRTVGIAPRRGRVTTEHDVAGQPLVVVVNDAMARVVWPGRDAIGQCLIVGPPSMPCRTVVGIVPGVHQRKVIEPEHMQFYLPLAQASRGGTERQPRAIIVRAAPERVPEVTRAVRRALDDALPNADLRLREMRTALEPQFRPWRLGASLFAALGTLALSVALIGLYGVIAYGVRRRTHELGVRLALGAQRAAVVRMIVAEAVVIVAASVVVGVVAALLGARFVSDLLYETSASDPIVLAAVASLLLGAGVAASSLPAWRASRVDPMVALRAE